LAKLNPKSDTRAPPDTAEFATSIQELTTGASNVKTFICVLTIEFTVILSALLVKSPVAAVTEPAA
jgi:hypothetical protein